MKVLLAIIAFMALAVIGLEPCPTEDSTLCYWDSASRGNGKGISFIAITEDFRISY